jgi:DNA-binding transcriptional LysR family regulator
MDLKRIKHALAVGDELNFARAAARVHLSQPALSRSIQALEEELGFRLFERNHHHVVLSPMGRMFLERARRLITDAERLQRDMLQPRARPTDEVVFGSGQLASILLPPVINRLRRSHPGLHIRLVEDPDARLLHLLKNGQIEFYIGKLEQSTAPDHDGDILHTPLCSLQCGFLCRSGHPLLGQKALDPHALLPFGFACHPLEQATRQRLRQWFSMNADEPLPVTIECNNLHLLQRLAQECDIILIGLLHGAQTLPLPAAFESLTVSAPPFCAPDIGIFQIKGHPLSIAAETLIVSLQELLR